MKNQKYVWNIVLVLAITVIALYFALKDNFNTIVHAILSMNILSLLVVLFWGALFTIVWGFVYVVLGRKYIPKYSIKDGIAVAFVGAFFAGITPSSTGGHFGQVYIMKKQGIKVSDSASILWADFIIYQTTMMIYVTILFILRYAYYRSQSGWFRIIFLGYLINLAVIIVLYTIALFPKVYIRLTGKLAKFMGRFKFIKDPDHIVDSWTIQVTQFTKEAKALSQDKRRIILCTFINLVRLTLLYSLPFAIALALHIQIPMSKLLDVIALSSFVIIANSFIPIPGASGGTEVVFTLLFRGLMGSLTGAVMILWRFSTYHVVVFIGAFIFIIMRSYYDRQAKKEVS